MPPLSRFHLTLAKKCNMIEKSGLHCQVLIVRKLKTKEVVQALKTLRKFAEMNGASDNACRSLNEFGTLCLKQREASKVKYSRLFIN